jgi:glycosyltransferase involved in cell wall biosynthesis
MTVIKKLSIVIPVYNEERTILLILEKIKEISLIGNIEKEIIIVNDCSNDGTEESIKKYLEQNRSLSVFYKKLDKNSGKGAALHTGIMLATGQCTVIQDADLEYDPKEFNLLLEPIINGHADVVYGSRFMGGNPHRVLFFWHSIGNHFLTFLSNMFSNLNLTDMETCYKLFRTDILQNLYLKEKRFGFEPEVTAKAARVPNIRIYEVSISYYGRTYKEGKKIKWMDGVRALYCILKYNMFSRNFFKKPY